MFCSSWSKYFLNHSDFFRSKVECIVKIWDQIVREHIVCLRQEIIVVERKFLLILDFALDNPESTFDPGLNL